MSSKKREPRFFPTAAHGVLIFLAALSFLIFVNGRSYAEDESGRIYSMEELATQSQSENPDVKKAESVLRQAAEDRFGEAAVESSRLTVSGGYSVPLGSNSDLTGTASTLSGQGASGFITQASVSLPVLAQVSVGGSVAYGQDQGVSGDLSLTVAPFALSPQSYAQEKAYGKAFAAQAYLARQTYFNAEQAVLGLQLAGMRKDYASASLSIEEEKYSVLEQEVDLGEAVLEDLLDQAAVLASAQGNMFTAESEWMNSWKDVQLLVFPKEQDFEIGQVSIENLLSYIERRSSESEKAKELRLTSQTLKNLELELEAMNSQLSVTPSWRPDVNLGASMSFPDLSLALSASLSFSPKDVVSKERDNLKEDIELKKLDIGIERFKLGLQVKVQTQGISIAERTLASAKKEQEKAELIAKESALLFDQGELTSLELKRSETNERLSLLNTYAAAANLYKAQADFIMLYADGN